MNGPVAQLGERRPCKAEAVGSNPAGSTLLAVHDIRYYGPRTGFLVKVVHKPPYLVLSRCLDLSITLSGEWLGLERR